MAYRSRQSQVPAVRIHRLCGACRRLARRAKLYGLQVDARRWRYLVPHRRRPPLVPSRRTASRCGDCADRAGPAARIRGGRGPPVLRASWGRSHRAGARGAPQHPRVRPRAGRQHADTAAGAHAVSLQSQELRPQGERGRARVPDRGAARQAADPRALPQSDFPRSRHLRRRGDVATRLRKARERPDAGGKRADCRSRARAGRPVAVVEPRRSAVAQPCRACPDAR